VSDPRRFEIVIARLARRAGPAHVARVLVGAGCAGVAAGLGLIGLGWYGAAHTYRVAEQIPYLISGGIAGAAVAVLGGITAMTGVWVWVRTREADEPVAEPAAAEGVDLVATRAGRLYHRRGCPVVRARTDVSAIQHPGHRRPCRVCTPDRRPAAGAAGT
jgi:hypothetical protein